MSFDFAHHFPMPLTLGAVSLSLIALGLYALIRKRPFVIHAQWLLTLVVVAFSPSVLMQLSWSFSVTSLISLLTTTILVCFIALQMRGYIVFGTTQDSFREALVSSLSNLNLKFEETLSSIRLPSVPAELQVAVHGWMGTAQLRLRNGAGQGCSPI